MFSFQVAELIFIIKLAEDDKIINGTSSLNWWWEALHQKGNAGAGFLWPAVFFSTKSWMCCSKSYCDAPLGRLCYCKSTSWTRMEGSQLKALKQRLIMGLVGMQSVLFRMACAELFPSCCCYLTWLQSPTPADSLIHLRSFQDRLLPPLVATSFLPHCRHAWFQICLERWLFA